MCSPSRLNSLRQQTSQVTLLLRTMSCHLFHSSVMHKTCGLCVLFFLSYNTALACLYSSFAKSHSGGGGKDQALHQSQAGLQTDSTAWASDSHLSPASEGVRPKPARGEKKTDDEATEPERLAAIGVSSTRGTCTDVVMRTGASGLGMSPSMPSTCRVVSSSCKDARTIWCSTVCPQCEL